MPNTALHGDVLLDYPENITATLTLDTDAQIIAAPSDTRLSIYVCSALASNGSATLTRLDLKEGSGGTIKFSQHLAANGGGYAKTWKSYWKLPAGVALFGDLGTAVTDVRVNIEYFVAL